MAKIAHLTDLHLVESGYAKRRGLARYRLSYLNAHRRINPAARRAQAVAAVRQAMAAAPDHLVVTGDLTDDGTPAQFELLGEVLEEGGADPARTTLVPGNHDGYADAGAYDRALIGPLRKFSGASRRGSLINLGDTLVVPISTMVEQSFTRSAGAVCAEDLDRVDRLGHATARDRRTVVVAQHHSPLGYRVAPVNWIDGFRDRREVRSVMRDHPHVHFLHGHHHRHTSHAIEPHAPPQIHGAAAVVNGSVGVRIYETDARELVPVGEAVEVGAMARAVAMTDGSLQLPALRT